MKIQSPEAGTSFYETVSDLIFATMAIFVLLMCVFIAQVNLKTGLEELEQQIQQERQRLKETQSQRQDAQDELAKAERSKQAFERYELQIVIAVDTTGSMQLELDLLSDTIALIAKVLPKIAASVEMGIIAYRRDEQNRETTQRFALQPIRDSDEDGGRSFRAVRAFVGQLRARAGSAPLDKAVDEALKMFAPADRFAGHQTFMLLGDVGPYEDAYRDQQISDDNRRQEQAMREQLRIWAGDSPTRNLLILFSGDDEIAKTSGDQHEKFLQSRRFFQSLAEAAGQPEGYTNQSSEMIPQLLLAALR